MVYVNLKIKRYPHRKIGKIRKETGRKLSDDENMVAKSLARFGYDMLFLKEAKLANMTNPDFFWQKDHANWEIKTLYGNSSSNTKHAFRHALSQSKKIVINAIRTKRDVKRIAQDILDAMEDFPSIKGIEVIIVDKEQYVKIP